MYLPAPYRDLNSASQGGVITPTGPRGHKATGSGDK